MIPISNERYKRDSNSRSVIDVGEIEIPSSPSILVVDDEQSVLDFVSTVFGARRIQNDSVRNLKKAEEAISEKVYDILFLDLGLPDGSGFSILDKVMTISPGVLVVVITAANDLETAVQAIRMGAFDYITKPFSMLLFQERLNIVIEEWKARTYEQCYVEYIEDLVDEMAGELDRAAMCIQYVGETLIPAVGMSQFVQDLEMEDWSDLRL